MSADATADTLAGAAADGGFTGRIAGFVAHLRLNGFALGPAEAAAAADIAVRVGATDAGAVRLAWKTLLVGSEDEWRRYDALFEAWWHRRGRERRRPVAGGAATARAATAPALWERHLGDRDQRSRTVDDAAPAATSDDGADGTARAPADRLVAARSSPLSRTDLRHVTDAAELAAAEAEARRLGTALRDRLNRRQFVAPHGTRPDLRRAIRRSLATGGEPFVLPRRRRRRPPLKLVALLDVSGSMKPYVRVFLQFLRGLVVGTKDGDAFLFHVRLHRVGDVITDHDPIRAMTRLALTADGFGGGTRFGACLSDLHRMHGRRSLTGRTVVLVLSDGYDTGPPEAVAKGFARLGKRVRRIVWLNPLAGWAGYEPVARAVVAARPHIDLFAPATTLADLAALEPALRRL
jgi:uncharacterized protein with von Willebrand factor type A (vWA) domain